MKRILIILTYIFFSLGLSAQTAKQDMTPSGWIERDSIIMPFDLEVHTGVTKNGKTIYYFIIEEVRVMISSTNYQKYINKEAQILLVEWYNPEKDLFKYTTREYQENSTEKINKK